MSEQVVVHIVDDDEAILASLGALLQSRFVASVGYRSGEEFLEHARWSVPGCLILDLRMPGMGGQELLRRLADDADPPPTIVLTAHGTIESAVGCVREGAVEFLEKPCANDRLLEAIDRAVALDRVRLTRKRRRDDLRALMERLTPREREILQGMVRGLSSPEIATRLGLQPKSVQIYRSHVLKKMGFATTVELVRTLLISDPDLWADAG